jgi:hypothetical protein
MRPLARIILLAAAVALVPLAAPAPAAATACTLTFNCGAELGGDDTLLGDVIITVCPLHIECTEPPTFGWPELWY